MQNPLQFPAKCPTQDRNKRKAETRKRDVPPRKTSPVLLRATVEGYTKTFSNCAPVSRVSIASCKTLFNSLQNVQPNIETKEKQRRENEMFPQEKFVHCGRVKGAGGKVPFFSKRTASVLTEHFLLTGSRCRRLLKLNKSPEMF
ncbi:hypothetical protein CEXT_300791 [Caerostris extrusa]|uniref:Uncharacterized protein n=1 Tax=Caerostris extrusa TaxID=172846 RepID=A0AAV4NJ63_CAEEX|nr:hypothetical protein CEXT_300791 [Caerostris extrusa]